MKFSDTPQYEDFPLTMAVCGMVADIHRVRKDERPHPLHYVPEWWVRPLLAVETALMKYAESGGFFSEPTLQLLADYMGEDHDMLEHDPLLKALDPIVTAYHVGFSKPTRLSVHWRRGGLLNFQWLAIPRLFDGLGEAKNEKRELERMGYVARLEMVDTPLLKTYSWKEEFDEGQRPD